MIIRLRGEFETDKFIEAIDSTIKEYVDEGIKIKGSLYLNLFNEAGDEIDIYDESGKSLEVTVTNKKKNAKMTVNDIARVKDLLAQGLTEDQIADALELSNEVAKDSIQTAKPKGSTMVLPILKKKQMNQYMFLKSELEINEYEEAIKEVGLWRNTLNKLEPILSVEEYCSEHDLMFFKNHAELYGTLMMKRSLGKRDEKVEGMVIRGLLLHNGLLEEVFSLEEFLNTIGIPYIPYDEVKIRKLHVGEVKGFTKEQLFNQKVGVTLIRHKDWVETNAVFDVPSLCEKYGYALISDEELETGRGKTLFSPQDVDYFYPPSYGVKEELTPYGFHQDGKQYFKTKKPLYEHFGLIEKEDIKSTDLCVDPFNMFRLRMVLSGTPLDLNDIKPDGMTENYEMVYRKGKIPIKIQKVFQQHLKKNSNVAKSLK